MAIRVPNREQITASPLLSRIARTWFLSQPAGWFVVRHDARARAGVHVTAGEDEYVRLTVVPTPVDAETWPDPAGPCPQRPGGH
jgi:hypothetical protein